MELKFRGKANINNEWIYATNIHKVILDDTNEELWVMHPKGDKIEHLGDGYVKYRPLVVDENSIGQAVGFEDKNGISAYTGDIISIKNKDTKFIIANMKVANIGCNGGEYGYDVTGVVTTYLDGTVDSSGDCELAYVYMIEGEFEIIGNVTDNKEMLNGTKVLGLA